MSVKIIWLIECDLCGLTSIQPEEGEFYTDFLISPPEDWDDRLMVPEKYRTPAFWNIADACPACKENPDWEAYKKRRKEKENS